eukprot:ctg_7186.g675
MPTRPPSDDSIPRATPSRPPCSPACPHPSAGAPPQRPFRAQSPQT